MLCDEFLIYFVICRKKKHSPLLLEKLPPFRHILRLSMELHFNNIYLLLLYFNLLEEGGGRGGSIRLKVGF